MAIASRKRGGPAQVGHIHRRKLIVGGVVAELAVGVIAPALDCPVVD